MRFKKKQPVTVTEAGKAQIWKKIGVAAIKEGTGNTLRILSSDAANSCMSFTTLDFFVYFDIGLITLKYVYLLQ